MKKLLLCTLFMAATLFATNAQSDPDNPIVSRPSAQELQANSTPQAMAINAVHAILNNDYHQIYQLLTSGRQKVWDNDRVLQALIKSGDGEAVCLFLFNDFLNIQPWEYALENGYKLAIGLTSFDSSTPSGAPDWCGVTVVCIPSNEIGQTHLDDISNYGDYSIGITTEKEDGRWRIHEIFLTEGNEVEGYGEVVIEETVVDYDDDVFIDAEDPEANLFHLDEECPVLNENGTNGLWITTWDNAIEQGLTPCPSCFAIPEE